jgi:hypothetical protein
MTFTKPDIRLDQLERVVLIMALGLLTALDEKRVTILDAQHLLFSPYTLKLLRRLDAKPEVVDLIHMGTELEDLIDSLPEAYAHSIAEMRGVVIGLLQDGPSHDFQQDKWLKLFDLAAPPK